eukprot:TRINITY_DN1676_c0_g1_i1.p1 TRINITY_DN1676_c0_g1~~TRINITY_DN1676_c0_g1_i1.p1  ORF type:complete len:516 (-),score=36.45 TRINITY_DN1676_c0_g1_i1:538-2085(-)
MKSDYERFQRSPTKSSIFTPKASRNGFHHSQTLDLSKKSLVSPTSSDMHVQYIHIPKPFSSPRRNNPSVVNEDKDPATEVEHLKFKQLESIAEKFHQKAHLKEVGVQTENQDKAVTQKEFLDLKDRVTTLVLEKDSLVINNMKQLLTLKDQVLHMKEEMLNKNMEHQKREAQWAKEKEELEAQLRREKEKPETISQRSMIERQDLITPFPLNKEEIHGIETESSSPMVRAMRPKIQKNTCCTLETISYCNEIQYNADAVSIQKANAALETKLLKTNMELHSMFTQLQTIHQKYKDESKAVQNVAKEKEKIANELLTLRERFKLRVYQVRTLQSDLLKLKGKSVREKKPNERPTTPTISSQGTFFGTKSFVEKKTLLQTPHKLLNVFSLSVTIIGTNSYVFKYVQSLCQAYYYQQAYNISGIAIPFLPVMPTKAPFSGTPLSASAHMYNCSATASKSSNSAGFRVVSVGSVKSGAMVITFASFGNASELAMKSPTPWTMFIAVPYTQCSCSLSFRI